MFGKRLRYLLFLAIFGVYYLSSGEWLSWFLLVAALVFPWLSLAVSLPALRQLTLSTTGGGTATVSETIQFLLLGTCDHPLPPFQGVITLEHSFTGQKERYQPDQEYVLNHCGSLKLRVEKARSFDYMGLFSFRVRRVEEQMLLIRPRPLPIPDAPLPEEAQAFAWRPKPGGGFAENHELRDYRPGDNLNQVHWKLSAKTGNLIIREAMEPVRGLVLLTMTLKGTPEELDRKLGRFLWMGDHLLNANYHFSLQVLTGQGPMAFSITSDTALRQALDDLLCTPPAASGSIQDQTFEAQWQYHIGGQPDET